MSEEEKLQLENECLMKYSKAQMIQKYIDELEESSKLSELWCKSQEENRKLKEVIDKSIKHVSSLSSKGRDCRIYANLKKDILDILKEVK